MPVGLYGGPFGAGKANVTFQRHKTRATPKPFDFQRSLQAPRRAARSCISFAITRCCSASSIEVSTQFRAPRAYKWRSPIHVQTNLPAFVRRYQELTSRLGPWLP